MKKIILISSLLFLFISSAKCQITYEASYPQFPAVALKYFNQNGQKWMWADTSFIYLYNLNHSLFRQIPSFYGNLFFVSDNLFDNDPSNFEFLIVRGTTMPNITVFREDGTQLFYLDSANILSSAMISNKDFSSSVVTTDSGTKLIVNRYTISYHTEIYSLPGILPCFDPCGIGSVNTPLSSGDNGQSYNPGEPYPNPTNSTTHIPYDLPAGINEGEIVFFDLTGKELKRYKVNRVFKELLISTSDLAAGSYWYQLQTGGMRSVGKKLIVIK